MIWNPTYRLQHKHRNASSERSPNHRKANYDLDQSTEENSKNPSLNSTLGCLKVIEPFRFLLEYFGAERNLSGNTQASYRDTLTLLLPFASASVGHAIDRMTVEDLTPSIVRQFIDHLERDRHCSCGTR